MTGAPSGRTEKPHLGDGTLVRRVVEVLGETDDRQLAARLALAKGVGSWVDTLGPWEDVIARHHVSAVKRGAFVPGIWKPRYYAVYEHPVAIKRLCSWDSVQARAFAEGLVSCYVDDCSDRPWGPYFMAPAERRWWWREGRWSLSGSRPEAMAVVS